EQLSTGGVELASEVNVSEAAQAVAEEHDTHNRRQRERLEKMQEYAEISTCRREHILRYFGDSFEGPCGNCDNCLRSADRVAVDPAVGTRREVTA
ncbi:MAG: RecQ family zinc-binding domain-containing protein, partial [Acidobacteriota bacterium]|nr:RecQ family zinc-binding domain-containing protein [Acidobacteriota bacterium]